MNNINIKGYDKDSCTQCQKRYIKRIDKKNTAIRLTCNCKTIITNTIKVRVV